MLFSQSDVVRILNERFECAWESVRPVPKVTIDFGDGRTLYRTLFGNVATYVTLDDGSVIDVVPGLVDPMEYQRRLEAAARLHARVVGLLAGPGAGSNLFFGPDPAARGRAEEFVRAYHGDVEAWDPSDPKAKLAELEQAQMHADLSKFRVEQPIKDWLRRLHVERLRDERRYEPAPSIEEGPEDHLLEDTAYNVRVRYPQARALLAALSRLATPAEITTRLYRAVLDVDLEDPYLGLAPYVLGGEAGRH